MKSIKKSTLALLLTLLLGFTASIAIYAAPSCNHSAVSSYYTSPISYSHQIQYNVTCNVTGTAYHTKYTCRICGDVLNDTITSTSETHSKFH